MNELIIAGQHTDCFTTLMCATKEEKTQLFNAVSNCSNRISDHVNEPITIKDVYVEMVELTNEETGEITNVPRTIIFDTKGESFVACSFGFFNALRKMFDIFGTPDNWDEPITIKPKQVHKGTNNILTFTIEK